MLAKTSVNFRTASPLEWLVLASLLTIVATLLIVMSSMPTFLNYVGEIFSDGNTLPASQICPQELLISTPPNGVVVFATGHAKADPNNSSQFTEFQFVIANLSNREVTYWGYRPDSYAPRLPRGVVQPLYSMAAASLNKWEPVEVGWCGTGAARMRLKAGQAGRFTAHLSAEHHLGKIGVQCYERRSAGANKEFVVWSEPFGLD